MDNSFISKDNIDNIYEYINVHFVKNHNYNLNSYDKYKKIIKKLAKTIFNSIKVNENYKNIVVNDFNDIVLNKSIDFLLKDINTKNRKNNINVKSSNSGLIQSIVLDNVEEPKKKKKSKKVKFNNNITSDVFNSFNQDDDQLQSNHDQKGFVNELDTFNDQVKAANKKIKDNFEQIISQSQDNFKSPEPLFDTKITTSDKNNSDKLAFEKILEDKIDKNTLSESTGSLYDDYSNSNIQDMLTSIIFKQKDNSKSNELESYEGEEYLPNLIKPVGEEAPIQPLIYQNTGTGIERVDKKVVTIDTGNEQNPYSSTVSNLGTNKWYKFKIDLQDTLKIDKLCDVYLRNVTVMGLTNSVNCSYLVFDIDEFNIRNYSNNPNMRNKIAIINTTHINDAIVIKINGDTDTVDDEIKLDTTINLSVGMGVSGTNIPANTFIRSITDGEKLKLTNEPLQVLTDNSDITFYTLSPSFNVNYGSEDNYVTTINPDKLTNLTITVTNQDNKSIDDENGGNNTFISSSNPLNRIIFELEFRSRGERDDIIYEKNMYSD